MRSSNISVPGVLLLALLIAGCGRKVSDADLASHDCTKTGQPGAGSLSGKPYTVYRDCKGDPAPTTPFEGTGGAKVTFAKFAGRPFLVSVWSMTSDDSADQLSRLNAFALRTKFRIVAINNGILDRDASAVDGYLKSRQIVLENYRTNDANLLSALHAAKAPTTILYNADGKAVWWIVGGVVDFDNLDGITLLAEAKPVSARRDAGAKSRWRRVR